MSFPSQIFRSYDIRGLVATELSDELAYAIGAAFVQFLRNRGDELVDKRIVIGMDMRPSSPGFAAQVKQAVIDQGVDVADIGLCTTPVFNFACAHYDEHAGGIMVTASHNPAAYNGFKPTLGNGLAIGRASGLDTIRDLAEAGNFSEAAVPGTATTLEVLPVYLEHVFRIVSLEEIKPLKIVLDAGNGMGKVSFPELLEQLPVEVEYLYLEPDGTFPNHEANPLKEETLDVLKKRVMETGADIGFALDGDCDRIGLVDERGEMVEPSFVGALVGNEVLRDHPGSHMLYDLRSSMIVPEVWEAAGATTEKCMVGHANIKKFMKDTGAAYASELSMHLYFSDMYDVESSDLSLLYVLRALSREGKPLSALIAPLAKYAHSGEQNFEVEDKDGAIARIKEAFSAEATEVSDLDGLWMGFDWGWLNVRKSNTEPVLRLNLEVRNVEEMNMKVAKLTALITTA